MAVRDGDDAEHEPGDVDASHRGRYPDITLDTGEVVIYDVDNAEAWVQSAAAVELDVMA